MQDFITEQKSFGEKIVEGLKARLKNNLEFDLRTIVKSNDCSRNVLIIQEPNDSVGKTVCLDDMFKAYQEQNVSIEMLVEELVPICEMKTPNFVELDDSKCLLEKMQDFDYLLLNGNITLKLINRSMSEKYLEGKAYLEFLDLAIVFCMIMKTSDTEIGTIAIPEEITKEWNVSLNQAFEKVLEVIEKENPIVRMTMFDFMSDMIARNLGDLKELEEFVAPSKEMYIQTNQQKINGSMTLVYKDNLLRFCEETGWSSIYIIPSSIHELLFIPITEEVSEENLKSMIVEVNTTQIADEEVLSNNLYIYNKVTNEIRICD